jgi:uncharacterized cupredoxin-like copper-binding protein
MRKPFLIGLFFILILVQSACSPTSTTNISVKMTDFSYTPKDVSVLAGKEITFNITNEGKVGHEFVIMKHGMTVGDDFGPEDEDNIYWEVEAKAGETKQVTFTAPTEPGDYQVVCGTPGHFMAGMFSKLTVVK